MFLFHFHLHHFLHQEHQPSQSRPVFLIRRHNLYHDPGLLPLLPPLVALRDQGGADWVLQTVVDQDRGLAGDHDTEVGLVLQDKYDEMELNVHDLLTNN